MNRLVTIAIALAGITLVVSTGATVVVDDAAERDHLSADLVAYPDPGPNGVYATIDDEGELAIELTEENPSIEADGVPSGGVNDVDDVFRLENEGSAPLTVWLESREERLGYHTGEGSIDDADGAVTIHPNESVAVGFTLDARGLEAGDRVTDVFAIHTAVADVEPAEASGAGGVSSDAPDLSVSEIRTEPSTPTAEAPATTKIVIENDGSAAGVLSEPVTVEGDVLEELQTVVAPGERETVPVEWTPASAGTYELSVGERAAATVTVEDVEDADRSLDVASLEPGSANGSADGDDDGSAAMLVLPEDASSDGAESAAETLRLSVALLVSMAALLVVWWAARPGLAAVKPWWLER